MKKRLSWILFLMLIVAAPVNAALVRCLVVQLSNNSKLYYPTSLNPVATFEGTVLHLNTDAMELSTVAKLSIEMVELVGIQSEQSSNKALVNNGQSVLLNTSETDVQIYSLTGIRLQTNITKQGELFTIDLSGLSKGTYLLRAGNQSWKFIKH